MHVLYLYRENIPIYPTVFLLAFLLALLLFISSSSSIIPEAFPKYEKDPTAYELLEQHNFPKGLLPRGVESYLLTQDGSFDVYFNGECEFKLKKEQSTYLLRYKRRIRGKLENGCVKELKGVSVKLLFIWVGITEVVRSGDDDDQLTFHLGLLSVSFPIDDYFQDCPVCRYDQLVDA